MYGTPDTREKADHLTRPVVLWEDAESSTTWALALDVRERASVEPQLRNHAWRCLGVLPAGTPVEDRGTTREECGDFAPCRLAGADVRCSVWALMH